MFEQLEIENMLRLSKFVTHNFQLNTYLIQVCYNLDKLKRKLTKSVCTLKPAIC